MTLFEEGRVRTGPATLTVDAVVVGLGAGGSMALRQLARASVSVLGLEAGGRHTPAQFNQREDEMLPLLFQDGGGRMTADLAIRVLQGRGVGGSTLHNTNLCKRTPSAILEQWALDYGVSGASAADLDRSYAAVEADLSITEIPEDAINGNNRLLQRGVSALGWRGGVLRHNRVGCRRSGFCELGCAYDAKQNAAKILVPQAMEAGGRVFSDARVDRILHDGSRATGVAGTFVDDAGNATFPFEIRAKIVVLGGSATGSAALALASNVPDPYDRCGRGLRLHPGSVAAGVFEQPVDAHRGIPQSYECTEYLEFGRGVEKRVWILTAFAHPIGTASMLPGFGVKHMTRMRKYRHLAVFSAMVHDETEGRVIAGEGGRPVLQYAMTEADRRQLAMGLRACGRLLLAAGATEVTFPAIDAPTVTTDAALNALSMDFVRPHTLAMSAVHPMGSMALGDDPKRSVVASTGEHHQLKGLFVADGSLFPTSLGVPPQWSIYAFAHHLSPHMIDAIKR